jgi:hypothetical protein
VSTPSDDRRKSEVSAGRTPIVVDRQTALAVGSIVVGFVVLWRPAVTLLTERGFEFVGPGAVVPLLAVAIGVGLVARGVQLLATA